MEYRTINPADIAASVLRDGVLQADLAAFQGEIETRRLQALAKSAKSAGDKAALRDLAAAAGASATKAQKRAARKAERFAVPAADTTAQRVAWLRQWIAAMESEHASHAALLADREASLALEGPNAPDAEERAEIERRRDENAAALAVIESAWKIATAALADLAPNDA